MHQSEQQAVGKIFFFFIFKLKKSAVGGGGKPGDIHTDLILVYLYVRNTVLYVIRFTISARFPFPKKYIR